MILAAVEAIFAVYCSMAMYSRAVVFRGIVMWLSLRFYRRWEGMDEGGRSEDKGEGRERESADTLSLEVAHDCAQPRQKDASNLTVDQEGKRLREPGTNQLLALEMFEW